MEICRAGYYAINAYKTPSEAFKICVLAFFCSTLGSVPWVQVSPLRDPSLFGNFCILGQKPKQFLR